jgi:hypothetical protein
MAVPACEGTSILNLGGIGRFLAGRKAPGGWIFSRRKRSVSGQGLRVILSAPRPQRQRKAAEAGFTSGVFMALGGSFKAVGQNGSDEGEKS